MQVDHEKKEVYLPCNIGLGRLAEIMNEYSEEYTFWITDELDEDTNIEW